MTPDEILETYLSVRPRYEVFGKRVADLLESLITEADIRILMVDSRAKTIDSLREKLSRPDKSYSSLSEIPDLAGVRVIAFYQDDCTRIAELVKSQFRVIEEELSHQKEKLGSDRFGYISAHYVVKLDRSRSRLTEWKASADLHCEIQIRTVIQHAWSVVSHQLQYKAEAVPSDLQRRLNRIAGLFELADEEFLGIRKQRIHIVEQISKEIEEKKSVPLSVYSLKVFKDQWWAENNGDTKVREIGFSVNNSDEAEWIRNLYNTAQRFGISTVARLRKLSGSFDEKYLTAQRDASETTLWSVNRTFVLQLHVLRALAGKVHVHDLTAQGWDHKIAERVLRVARQYRIGARKRT
jgi:ppGpp synthetase/RelA/SpoT-type nucleotidyltranferase